MRFTISTSTAATYLKFIDSPLKWFIFYFALGLVTFCYLFLVLFGRISSFSSFDNLLKDPKTIRLFEAGIFTNGAFIDFQGEQWMALRKIDKDRSYIYLGNYSHEIVSNLKRLFLRSEHAEDPRLIVYKGQLVCVYNDLKMGQRRMHLAFLKKEGNSYQVEKIQSLTKEEVQKNTEKNWVPFVHDDKLFFLYETNPWTVLEYHEDGHCTIFTKKELLIPGETPKLSGGSPAIKCNGEYVGFFHIRSGITRSYISWNRYVYFVGAYAFDSKPPFLLKRMTVKPLSYKGAYHLLKNPKKILYPVGVLDKGEDLFVSMGVNDDRTEVVRVSKEALFCSMVDL